MNDRECINLINEKLAVADMERDEFIKYVLEKHGVSLSHDGSIYASKCGILMATLNVLKIELETREEIKEKINARNKDNI